MKLKVNILSKLIETDEEIVYVVWRHWWAYRWVILKTIIFTLWVFLLYSVLAFVSEQWALIISGTIGILLYIVINIEFFDVYLDNVLFTPSSIITFKWYGLFNNTMDTITFHSVESLYQEQHGILDIFFDKWKLVIRRQWHENIFENIPHAGRTIREINAVMDKYTSPIPDSHEEDEEHNPIKDDFGLFVEAMWEIMREYKEARWYERQKTYIDDEEDYMEDDYLEKD